jgi:hypothetical protein
MSAPNIRKLRGGCYALTLVVPPDIAEFALESYRAQGFEGAEVYLASILNSAMVNEMAEAEMAATHAAAASAVAAFDEFDGDIPF